MSAEEHSSQTGIVGVFSRAAATYDTCGPRFFSQLGRRLVEVSQITPGTRVLDVASGRGAVLFAAADQVGPEGRVVGIDLAENMVRETTAEIQSAGWKNVELHQMSADQLDVAAQKHNHAGAKTSPFSTHAKCESPGPSRSL